MKIKTDKEKQQIVLKLSWKEIFNIIKNRKLVFNKESLELVFRLLLNTFEKFSKPR
jgi:hypothetical protein